MITTILAFIVTLGVVVTIHEYGHFQVARWCSVRVLRFSVGFGKSLWKKMLGKDQTEFVLAAIPLGGYVKMLDENELKAEREFGAEQKHIDYSEAELARAFNRQSVYKRIAIVIAGPVANLILAIFIYWALIMQGVAGVVPILGQVQEGSLAAQARFASGEQIRTIDAEKVETWEDVNWAILNAAFDNKTIKVATVDRNGKQHLRYVDLSGVAENAEANLLKRIGFEPLTPDFDPIIERVVADSAALKAGLMSGDRVLSVDGVKTATWSGVVNIIQANPEQQLQLEIGRKSQVLKINVTPMAHIENGQEIGKIGVAVKIDQAKLDAVSTKRYYSVVDSLGLAASKTWETSIFSLKMMWYMVIGKTSWKGISGPVTIASYAGQSADLGLDAFLRFIALVSISIGILNLLPIPVLDGGHLMYYMAEIIKGSAVTEQTMLLGQKVGFGLLGLLMTLAIFNDINRIVAG